MVGCVGINDQKRVGSGGLLLFSLSEAMTYNPFILVRAAPTPPSAFEFPKRFFIYERPIIVVNQPESLFPVEDELLPDRGSMAPLICTEADVHEAHPTATRGSSD